MKPPIAPLKVGDSVTKTTVMAGAWLVTGIRVLEEVTSGEAERLADAALIEDVAGWPELEAAGGGPLTVTWTVVMMVVEN